MITHETYMRRCLELAEHGRGHVAPNPMVGAVLVHDDKIIGEGFHKKYGEAHAEVNCINSVKEKHRHLIPSSSMYVSLEPCAHYGKTPPCTDLILKDKIPQVIIGCRDSYEEVNGKGIAILREAGIEVVVGLLEDDCLNLNTRFFTYHKKKRPYIILKWAQSIDGKIAADGKKLVPISCGLTNRLVHRWRTEEASILVGTETALIDDPQLTARLWKGKDPVRLVTDRNLRLPPDLKLFDQSIATVVFNTVKHEDAGNLIYYKLDALHAGDILTACYNLNLQSVIIEGGTALLQSFIDEKLYDEIRIITNTALRLPGGFASPEFKKAALKKQEWLATDLIQYYS
jgi:diaminohydroxyphosphoribosylaminopyrimidine deaminase/5-amino-6-(5-phosphoribosylamino)uracil reductase